ADRRLRSLHHLVDVPGSSLVAHRPERRGVVRRVTPDGGQAYTKLVPPNRIGPVADGARLSALGVATARATDIDERRGSVTFEALPGRPLFEVLGDPPSEGSRIEEIGHAVGDAVARTHRVAPPTQL